LRRDGPWANAITRHTVAVQAAQHLGDRLTNDYPGAAQAQEQALSVYRDIGDRLGQAGALIYLGAVRAADG
jgi:hypothetical protein